MFLALIGWMMLKYWFETLLQTIYAFFQESEGKADFLYVDVWSSQYSWGGNPPPEDGTLVVIGPGQTIVLDTKTAKLKMLLIKG